MKPLYGLNRLCTLEVAGKQTAPPSLTVVSSVNNTRAGCNKTTELIQFVFCSLICIKSRNNHNIAEIYRKALKLGHPIELDDLSSFSL